MPHSINTSVHLWMFVFLPPLATVRWNAMNRYANTFEILMSCPLDRYPDHMDGSTFIS